MTMRTPSKFVSRTPNGTPQHRGLGYQTPIKTSSTAYVGTPSSYRGTPYGAGSRRNTPYGAGIGSRTPLPLRSPMLPPAPRYRPAQDVATYFGVQCTVIKGLHLARKDAYNCHDVFVEVDIDGEDVWQSSIVSDSDSPIWKDGNSTAWGFSSACSSLNIAVFGRSSGTPTLLGTYAVPVRQWFDEMEFKGSKAKSGELDCELSCASQGTLTIRVRTYLHQEPKATVHPASRPVTLGEAELQARSLQFQAGKSDTVHPAACPALAVDRVMGRDVAPGVAAAVGAICSAISSSGQKLEFANELSSDQDSISLGEFTQVLCRMAGPAARLDAGALLECFDSLDHDSSGVVSRTEVVRTFEAVSAAQKAE